MPRLRPRFQRIHRLRTIPSQPLARNGTASSAALPAVLAVNESILNTFHSTGLPWWATIMGATLVLRGSLTLPIAIYQQRSIGRMIQLAPMIQSWGETIKSKVVQESKQLGWPYERYEQELQRQYRGKVNEIYAHYGCSRWKLLLLPYVQIPLFISMSLTLRHMTGNALPWFGQLAEGPAPALNEGGFGWVTDLTLTDPTWVFPVLIGAGNLINVELNAWYARGQPKSRTQKIMTHVFRWLSVAMVPIAAHAPMAIGLYWFTSSWFSVVQNVAFRIPSVRRTLRLPALPSPKSKALASSDSHSALVKDRST